MLKTINPATFPAVLIVAAELPRLVEFVIDNAVGPGVPEKPDMPEKPLKPLIPLKPEMPENPDIPEEPEKPLIPVAPELGAAHDNVPDPLVDKTYPAVPPVIVTLLTGPRLDTPLTISPVNVPNEVIAG